MFKRTRRKKILGLAEQLTPPAKAQAFRAYVANGERDQRLLLGLCDLAIDANPQDSPLWRYRAAIAAGRRVKITSYPVTFLSFEGTPANLVHQIEEVFQDADQDS